MTINLNDKAAGNVYFTVHYMNVFGKVKSDNVTLNFNEKLLMQKKLLLS